MDAQQTIQTTYDVSRMVLTTYINDLSDEELMTRPGEGCNHIAFQLGHLICSEVNLLKSIAPGHEVALPEGFAEKHDKANHESNDPADFCSKDEYMRLLEEIKAATSAALRSVSDEDLEKPAPEFLRSMFPNVGAVYVLIATHAMMHAGQFVPVRRKLGKPVTI